MQFNDIKNRFSEELKNIDEFIINNLKSDIELVNDIGKYIILYGGKRIRPLITILLSKIFSYNEKSFIAMSAAIELIHTATLLHDDVVDSAEKRRGKLSINKIWGNKEAILVGDFLYTRSFQIMVSTNNIKILKLMAKTTNMMSEGEINQLINKNNLEMKEEDYFKIIKAKTAKLFAASAEIIPILANSNDNIIKKAANFGMNLGIAYQLIDDVLDYMSNEETIGKKIGEDISNGIFTLPLIHLISKSKDKKEFIKDLIKNNKTKNNFNIIKKLIIETKSSDYTLEMAKKHANLAKKAILDIENNEFSKMAIELIDITINRKY